MDSEVEQDKKGKGEDKKGKGENKKKGKGEDKKGKVEDKKGKGEQDKKGKRGMTGNADKRQQQADENRQASLKLASEQMQKAFLGDNGLLVDKILLAGPGNMKALLLKVLPQNLAKVTETMTVSRSGRSGLYDLAKMLEAEDEKLRKESLQQAKVERAQYVKSIRGPAVDTGKQKH